MSCGGNCRCGSWSTDQKPDEACATPKAGVVLDGEGKCPCGKELKDCCHKDALVANTANEALEELCVPTHDNTSLCGDEHGHEKTA